MGSSPERIGFVDDKWGDITPAPWRRSENSQPTLSLIPGRLTAQVVVSEGIEKMFNIQNPVQVADYIASHEYLSDALRAAPSQISKFFGDSLLNLEFFPGQQFGASDQLRITVQANMEYDPAYAALHELRAQWYRCLPMPVKRSLTVSVDHI